MTDTLPLSFTHHILCPFDSCLVVDHTVLARHAEEFRRRLCGGIPRHDGRRVVAQVGGTRELTEGEEAFRSWLDGAADEAHERFGAHGSGHERRAPSLVCVDLEEVLEAPCEDELLEGSSVRFEAPRLSFHEYGIGLLSAKARLTLRRAPGPGEIRRLLERVALLRRSAEIGRLIEVVDRDVCDAGEAALASLDLPRPVFSREDVTDPDVKGLLWTHGVSVFDEPSGTAVPFGELAAEFTNVARRDEIRNLCPSLGGFVFLGWGRSLLVGLDADARNRMLAVLRRLELDWRAGDQYNSIFMGRLKAYTDLAEGSFRRREPMRWIERATVELDLHRSHFDEHFQMLDPYSHAVAKHVYASWRIPEQSAAAEQKLASLNHLYAQGAARIARRNERQFNVLLAVITVIALSSAGVDGASALAPRFAEQWPLVARLGVVFGVPLLAILVLGWFVCSASGRDA